MGIAGPKIKDNLRSMEPEEFEHFVAELWEQDGWDTNVTQQSKDAGVDIIATRDSPVAQKAAIQVKRYAKSNRVGSADVQQYSALKRQEDADFVAVVTSSSFTKSAHERAEELNVRLVDSEDLTEKIHEEDATGLVSTHTTEDRGEVASPSEFSHDVVSRLRLSRGLPYLLLLSLTIALHWLALFEAVPAFESLLWVSWFAIPAAAWIHASAVPEVNLSRDEIGAMVLLPMFFGPVYLYKKF
jgi:hypothetical protein